MAERTTAVDWRHVLSTALGVLAGAVATAGTLAVAVAGFTLSFDAIRAVGQAAHMRHDWAWLLPVSIDGAMAVGTVTAVVMSRMGKPAWYPWLVVLAGAGISIACNALHAKMGGGAMQLDQGGRHTVAMAVSAIPAVMLALSVHLLVVLIDAAARTLGEADDGANTKADRVPVRAATAVAELDEDAAALCQLVRLQARQARTAVMAGFASSRPLPPLRSAPPLTATVAVPPVTVEPATQPAKGTTASTPGKRGTSAKQPISKAAKETATKVAKWHAKMPDATHAEIAAKAGVSVRSVERYRPAKETATKVANES